MLQRLIKEICVTSAEAFGRQPKPLLQTPSQTAEPQKIKVAVCYRVASTHQLDNKEIYVQLLLHCIKDFFISVMKKTQK